MRNKKNARSISFRAPEHLWNKLDKFMQDDRRDITNAIVVLMWEALEKRGYHEKGND